MSKKCLIFVSESVLIFELDKVLDVGVEAKGSKCTEFFEIDNSFQKHRNTIDTFLSIDDG